LERLKTVEVLNLHYFYRSSHARTSPVLAPDHVHFHPRDYIAVPATKSVEVLVVRGENEGHPMRIESRWVETGILRLEVR